MSATKRSGNGRRGGAPEVSKAEALEMLASAVNYCQQAGLPVKAGNSEARLAIVIDGAQLEDTPDGARFTERAIA